MSVCKIVVLNLLKKCWLAPGRVLAGNKKNAFCHCHFSLLSLLEGKYKTLEFD